MGSKKRRLFATLRVTDMCFFVYINNAGVNLFSLTPAKVILFY